MYRKIKANQIPKGERKTESRFEKTAEWKMMKADIDHGLKVNEALQVVLTPEDKKRYKIKNTRIVDRFLKSYLKEKGLPYTAKRFRRDEGEYIVVQYTPVISHTA